MSLLVLLSLSLLCCLVQSSLMIWNCDCAELPGYMSLKFKFKKVFNIISQIYSIQTYSIYGITARYIYILCVSYQISRRSLSLIHNILYHDLPNTHLLAQGIFCHIILSFFLLCDAWNCDRVAPLQTRNSSNINYQKKTRRSLLI